MIVIPTEKKFDWRYTPVVLFFIVLCNVLVFFLYQSGDSQKQIDAFRSYDDGAYLELEWPIYQEYLSAQDREAKDEAVALYEKGQMQLLVSKILVDRRFYAYLEKNAHNHLSVEQYDSWKVSRVSVQDTVNSISAFAHGLVPSELKVHTLITHQFLHGGLMHLMGNLFFLVICGFAVEASIGHLRFLVYYLVGGIVAGLAHSVLDLNSTVPLVGASGAISGVMAMYLAVFRFRKIEFFYWLFVFVGYFRAPALLILPIYLGKEVYSYFSDPEAGVAFMAHAGGFVAGAVLISIELMINRNMLNTDYLEEDQEQNPEQELLAEIYEAIGSYRFKDAITSLDNYEDVYGKSFDTLMVRYNLTKIKRGKAYGNTVLEIFEIKNLVPRELQKLVKIFKENLKIAARLDESRAIKLAMQLAGSDSPECAEKLFGALVKRGSRHADISVLARKLSVTYAGLEDFQKKQKYASLADKLAESNHGVL